MTGQTDVQKLKHSIAKRFHKAISQYSLIEDGDKILVGVSGGKDSLCLLELLSEKARIQRPAFKIEAVHIRMENIHYETDTTYLQHFADRLGVRLHIITTRFGQKEGKQKPACFLCSWHRRKQIFNLAQELKCNKIALGHNMDDIIHTTLMNLFFQGHFSTMPVRLCMHKMALTIIRPLCLVREADIQEYATISNYEKQLKLCPFENKSHRADIRRLYDEIENMYPDARYSIWNALESENKLIE